MTDCLSFWINPDSLGEDSNPPPDDPVICSGGKCACGYLQYESLIPYLKEINDLLKNDPDKATQLEFKLREKIVEISRLFDIDAGVEAGFFSKAHYTTTKLFASNGTKYIKIPEFVPNTLEVRTNVNFLLDESTYGYKDGYLIYLPCMKHVSCSCTSSCGETRSTKPLPWGGQCYKITARWGKDCADMAVQMAVRDYLIEGYRVQDPVASQVSGLPINRTFRVPHSWETYIRNFKAKRKIHSQWAVA